MRFLISMRVTFEHTNNYPEITLVFKVILNFQSYIFKILALVQAFKFSFYKPYFLLIKQSLIKINIFDFLKYFIYLKQTFPNT